MKQPFIYAAKSLSTTARYEVQWIPMLFMNMRETCLKWMSGVDWRGTRHWTILLHRDYSHRTCYRTLLLTNFPQDRFSSKMGHCPIIIDRCMTSWMQIFPICGSEEEDPLPSHPGHPIWSLWIFFWGFVKNVVYQWDRPTTLEELRGRITNAEALVTPQMLQNTWRELNTV